MSAFTAEHARKYAAKWRADDHEDEPTDGRLRRAFAYCVRPAKPEEYAAIRKAIADWQA